MKYTVLFVLGKCLMDSEQVILIFTEVWPTMFMSQLRLSEGMFLFSSYFSLLKVLGHYGC